MANIIYDQDEAARVTHENLAPDLKLRLTSNEVYTVLEMKFLADGEDIDQTTRMCKKMGLDVTYEIVQAVALAEEVYLRRIGVME